jgi:uncharacterized membrane protein YdbT with pleckstrin-like domain
VPLVDLHPGENVLFEGHPSWRSILGFYLKGLVLAAVAGGVAALVTKIADDKVKSAIVIAAAAAVFAIVLVVGLLKRIATTYTISNQRLHIKRGIVSRRVQQTNLDRVQNVNTNQSMLERLLQVGTVDFDTAGTDDSDFTFAGVSQPERVVQAVDKAQREAAAARPAAEADAAGAPAPDAEPPPPAAPAPPV